MWFHRLPYKLKLLTLGNHELSDSIAYRPLQHWQSLFGPMLLLDRGVRANIAGTSITVFGLPHAPDTQRIPAGVDVVLSHEPPCRILDETRGGGHAGSERIAELVGQARPKLHVFGHVHAAGGKTQNLAGIAHVNAATRPVLYTLDA
jgi:calcineurin-like phosphoesterase family protein